MQTVLELIEGYWATKGDSRGTEYPTPVESKTPWVGRDRFISSLYLAEISPGVEDTAYRGWSTCRCCGVHNGSHEFKLTHKGITFRWPEGFLHYVEEHNIRPSYAFQQFIASVAPVEYEDEC